MRKLFSRKSNSPVEEKDVKCVKKQWTSLFKSQTTSKLNVSLVDNNTTGSDEKIEKNSDNDWQGVDAHAVGVTTIEKSWDTVPNLNNSFSTVESSATISTLKHFGLSNHPGKGADDVTIDAFMDINNDQDSKSRKITKSVNLKPRSADPQHSALLTTALSCIAKRDFNQFMSIIETSPSILLCKCKRRGQANEGHGRLDERPDPNPNRGCYGGTLLHVLVSQKPALKKKRVENSNSIKSRLTNALAGASKVAYELHIMPSVPDSVLTSVIKLQPKALKIVDDYGRLPIHCATLSLSVHLEEVNKMYGTHLSDDDKFSYNVSRIIVREINLIRLLLKYNRKGASFADLKGNLPIHYAVSIGPDYFESNEVKFEKNSKYKEPSGSETVEQLLEAYPQSVSIENREGNLPIHVICSRGADLNLTILKKIITCQSIRKDVLTRKNRVGDPPLFLAIKSRAKVEAIRAFASVEQGMSSNSHYLFAQRDSNNNNILHIALRLVPSLDLDVIHTILSLAPFTASTPDSKGIMPIRYVFSIAFPKFHETNLIIKLFYIIRYAMAQGLPEDIIRQMLARDMPIQIGADIDSIKQNMAKSCSGFTRHDVGRSHYHSWWHILMESNDKYLDMVRAFLSEEATHAQIVSLARQVGPDGISILINCVSNKCRFVFHGLLCFYDRYEILLSSKDSKVKPDEIIDGVQTFLALDHGLSTEKTDEDFDKSNDDSSSKIHQTMSNSSCSSEISISTAVRVRNDHKDESAVEVSSFVTFIFCFIYARELSNASFPQFRFL